ncbi:hypothetical protein LAZ29_01680 [Cereibacter sphaeroides]|uniref:hypothetical protein n=1 Tax=Cereibacter sphaeroides TaxID=1063 RepID=UPI001F27EB7A|nr:hypothetical protein [Cereibacter sphaeroides]MCE6949648.1 hypothetical protein [Cereibacter sphaeroides]
MIDLNDEAASWTGLLAAATANAITDFEVEFCESLRQKLEKFGARARLTEAQFYKLTCIAQAGGFWERDQ